MHDAKVVVEEVDIALERRLTVADDALATRAMFVTWMGSQSSHCECIRTSFEKADPAADPSAEAVRQAGVRIFGEMRDKEAAKEEQKRITGDL